MYDFPPFADEFGPLNVSYLHEPSVGLKAVLVIDNVAAGPSIGGVRMAPDVSAEEAFRLARAMTLKNAAADLSHGGGKAVIYADPKMDRQEKEQLIRCFASAIAHCYGYIPGPDMGTDEMCMAWMKDEIGRAVGLPREIGGIPLDEIGATGFGLSCCVDVALKYCDLELDGARLVVQGFGSVGRHAARFLQDKGVKLIGASDSQGAIHDPEGLDIEKLVKLKHEGKSVAGYQDGERLNRDGVIDIPCDIWVPAARPDVIHEDNVHRLQTRLVVEGANIPFTEGAEKILHQLGVLVVPDFIANAGGVICAAVEYHQGSQHDAFQAIEEKIRANTGEVLREAAGKNMPPRQAAVALSIRRLKTAMECKRWALF
ncbi:MAG: Glu/Leu/Phe/Val dehydrogenase [Desulfobulbaceae bacterium]|nr:Glu/Leu/Phe/Val dehydrogenase [Desulfobulbaceae bacterium]